MPSTHHVATVTDPVTGEEHEFTAGTAAELDELLETHLRSAYPHPAATHHENTKPI